MQQWLEHTADQQAKKLQLARADAKAQRTYLRRSLTALRLAVEQAQEMADASQGFLQESQVGI